MSRAETSSFSNQEYRICKYRCISWN
ncbi:hypothetical protein Godav_003641 [Gossypium davidsonii]|uniref:Uncharacterized protein n=2 Tax=Gossypium TaxID=3633 RepID=A0A7J8SJ17_GOSDV|nr:hypothetical protein [Gossypium davidsonii]